MAAPGVRLRTSEAAAGNSEAGRKIGVHLTHAAGIHDAGSPRPADVLNLAERERLARAEFPIAVLSSNARRRPTVAPANEKGRGPKAAPPSLAARGAD